MNHSAFVSGAPRQRRTPPRLHGSAVAAVTTARSGRPLQETPTVIVGAGPCGLTTAIMLAEVGFQNLTIIERSPRPTSSTVSLGYSFVLFERGLKLLRLLPDVMDCIFARASVSQERMIVSMRTEGTKEIPCPSNMNTLIRIMRWDLIFALQEALVARHPRLKIHWQARVTGVEPLRSGGAKVTFVEGAGEGVEKNLHADFVVACDGFRSAVRSGLTDCDDVVSSRGFGLCKTISASVGLAFRVIATVPGPKHMADRDAFYCIYGDSTVPVKRRFNLGFFPDSPDPLSPRVCIIVLPTDHELWKVSNVEDCFTFFEESFPHLPMREVFSRESMESFLNSSVGNFPPIQRSSSLVGQFAYQDTEGTSDTSTSGGVVLLGDAAHAFPPDLGQGVNGALEDVFILREVIQACMEKGTVHDVVAEYERRRDEDIWALMNITKHGNPYQYYQGGWRKRGIMANLLLRSKLAKLAPMVFHPSIAECFLQDIPYGEMWQRSQQTTRRIWGIVIILVLSLTACLVLLQ